MNNKASRNPKLWIFNAAQYFSGNPKWLYLYICKRRPDIHAVWLTDNNETIKKIKNLGFSAYSFSSDSGRKTMQQAGVYVVEQFKEILQDELSGIKILNLWHGVGCKSIELKISSGFLAKRIAKKHIENNQIYKNQQLFLTTSPLMEKHFSEQCGLLEENIVRATYPRCFEKIKFNTFDHSILQKKRITPETKFICYAPTYREINHNSFISSAIPDFEVLIKTLEKNDLIFIFKAHPLMESYLQYKTIHEKYKNENRIIFWDNNNDFYEIIDEIDIAIIDYSSIFYDFLASGVSNFIKYFFDYDEKCGTHNELALNPEEMTCGVLCKNFSELISSINEKKYEEHSHELKAKEIFNLFYSYTKKNNNEYIINQTLEFKIKEDQLPILYSFDIFDTIIKRSTLKPEGVFFKTQNDLRQSCLNFPEDLVRNYPEARKGAESNERYLKRTIESSHGSNAKEIKLSNILERLSVVYKLNEDQINFIKHSELSAEYESIIPQSENIEKILELVAKKNDVILISDMYLPEYFIKKILAKCHPILETLPLFLSSTTGVQKSNGGLYINVINSINYKYSSWQHFGDNKHADGVQAESLGIKTHIHEIPDFNEYELDLINSLRNYDSYCLAALFSRKRFKKGATEMDKYIYSHLSIPLVTYVYWVIQEAIEKNIECLYFISRDGHHLKSIADQIIKHKKINIKTKYIYGSRKSWWLPSYKKEIDRHFFSSFIDTNCQFSYSSLIDGLYLDKDQFEKFFPEFTIKKESDIVDRRSLITIINTAQNHPEYISYLLDLSSKLRSNTLAYLNNQINSNESFAFVEYWGLGYTQKCLYNLLEEINKTKHPLIFFYARSILQSDDKCIRINFTVSPCSLIFIESIFANLPYDSNVGYELVNGIPTPITPRKDFDELLFKSLEKEILNFTEDYCKTSWENPKSSTRLFFDWSINYFKENKDNIDVIKYISNLKDSTHRNGISTELTPPIKLHNIIESFRGKDLRTQSLEVSLEKSGRWMRALYLISNLPFFRKHSKEVQTIIENQKLLKF